MSSEEKSPGEASSPNSTDQASSSNERHSIFTTPQKWLIVSIVSYAACFSTLSSLIYYPAIPALSSALDKSTDKIDLTVTVYMAVASIAPALVGDTADTLGRRPVYILTLGLYFLTNLAIALTKTYSALLGLRALQALSISGTFSIAYGVIADVAAPAERGSFAALVSFAIGVAPTMGPILGGALTYAAGWSWIFWFLCIASGVCLVTIILFLPETCRGIVGDGSVPVPRYLQPLVPGIMRHGRNDITGRHNDIQVQSGRRVWRFPNPLKSIVILARPDNTVIATACSLLYTVYTCIAASLATLLVPIYDLSQWEAGLIYIPLGVGGIVSTFISGQILDRAWRDARLQRGLPVDKGRGDDLDSFPVERARLGVVWVPMGLTVAFVVGFGWVLHFHTHISVPLLLQFFTGLVMQLAFSVYNTLLIDKNHRSPAAAQAATNMLRCTLSAVAISFLQNIVDALSIGWTFTFMGGLCLLATGLFVIDYCKGMDWRLKYSQRERRREDGQLRAG